MSILLGGECAEQPILFVVRTADRIAVPDGHDWRDPLVGRDVLAGVAAGALGGLLFGLESAAPAWFGYPPALVMPVFSGTLDNVATPALFVGQMLFDMSFVTLGISLAMVFLLVLLRALLRREWAAVAVWVVLLSALGLFSGEAPLVSGALNVMENLVLYTALRRFGLVALPVASFVQQVTLNFPATFNSSAWYAGYGYVALAIVAAIALYGFRTSLGGRPVFAGGNLDG